MNDMYLAAKLKISEAALSGTLAAHTSGGVPIQTITMDGISEENLGRLIYFFQHSVSIGGYLLGVNPFDQPGVELTATQKVKRRHVEDEFRDLIAELYGSRVLV